MRKPLRKKLFFLGCQRLISYTSLLSWAPTQQGCNLRMQAPTCWEHQLSLLPSTNWVKHQPSNSTSTHLQNETKMSPLAPPYLPYLLDFTNESNHNNTDVSWLTKHSSLFNINSLLLLFCSTCLAHSSVPLLCCSIHILSIRSPFLSIVLLLIRFNLLYSTIFSFVSVISSLPPHHRSSVLYLRFISS